MARKHKDPGTSKRAKQASGPKGEPANSDTSSNGPVTLDEARELAGLALPSAGARALAKNAVTPVPQAGFGEERQQLLSRQREERIRRIRDYLSPQQFEDQHARLTVKTAA